MATKTGFTHLDNLAVSTVGHPSFQTEMITLGLIALSLALLFFKFTRKPLHFEVLEPPEAVKAHSYEAKAPSSLVWPKFFRDTAARIQKPFVVKFPDLGPTVVLPPQYTKDVKNNKDMSLQESGRRKDFFPNIPGFEAIKAGSGNYIFHDAIRIRLTQSLTYFTDDLSDESTNALPDIFPFGQEWQEAVIQPKMLDLVTRLSSLIFIGRDFEYSKEWRDISSSYAVNMFQAAHVLRLWNPWLQPIVHWFLPETTKLRAQVKQARKIIEPEVARRRLKRQEAIKNGILPKKSLDSVDWFEDCSNGKHFDFAGGVLLLSVLAIHSTSGTLTNAMLDICANHELIEPLRDEIRTVLAEDGGLQKTSFHKMKLMDSVLKESQRLHPLSTGVLRRRVMADFKLHDGTILREGTYTVAGPLLNYDETTYDKPYEFNGYRFFNMRQQPGEENKWQFVTTSDEHMAFGHGIHACPGRFFAANAIKIAMMHLLIKYDWKLPDGEKRPESLEMGVSNPPHPAAKLMFRAREENVSF